MNVDPQHVRTLLRVRAAEEVGTLEASHIDAAMTRAVLSLPEGTPGEGPLEEAEWAFLLARSRELAPRIPDPGFSLPSLKRWLPFTIVGGFLLGVASHWIGLDRRFNLLGGPILAVLGWNAIIYVSLILCSTARVVMPRKRPRFPGLTDWVGRMVRRRAARQGDPRCLREVELALPWAASWIKHGVSMLLSLVAALFALGLIAAIYLRGVSMAYVAGWESTWLGGGAVAALLAPVLAPASALTGIALPGTEAGWEALRFGAASTPAGPWIHLYALTLMLFVVVPRVLLAGWHRWHVHQVLRRLPPWDRDDPYVARLLHRTRRGGGESLVIAAYGLRRPAIWEDEKWRRSLLDAPNMPGAMSTSECRWLPPAVYGEEVDAIQRRWDGDGAAMVLVFDGSATPEDEVHGEVLERFSKGPMAHVFVLFVEMGGLPEARLKSRRALWEEFSHRHGVDAVFSGG